MAKFSCRFDCVDKKVSIVDQVPSISKLYLAFDMLLTSRRLYRVWYMNRDP